MTAREYLNQAYRLEQRMALDRERLEDLRTLSSSVGSPGLEPRRNPNCPTEASFVNIVHRIVDQEEKVARELKLLVKLKIEIQEVIDRLPDTDERLVLTYRYLKSMSWSQIADRLYVNERTVRRWHGNGLSHIRIPANPTVV